MAKEIEQKKEPYEKPDIKIIELVADEVLAVGCKINVVGSGKITAFTCISPTKCYSLGS